jgi:predicted nucleic acid-binding Zn ribbon protein
MPGVGFRAPGSPDWQQLRDGRRLAAAVGRVHKISADDVKLPWTGTVKVGRPSNPSGERQAIAPPPNERRRRSNYILNRDRTDGCEVRLVE